MPRVAAESGEDGAVGRPGLLAVTIRSRSELDDLRRRLGTQGTLLLEKLNRRDLRHMRSQVELAVPESPYDIDAYSPFPPELPQLADIPKAILVALRIQAFGAFERGRLVRWGPVSSGGRHHQTPAGLYHTNWRSRRKVSTINAHWIMPWYFNLHTSMGVAFHEYAIPGLPESYGCIRLVGEDARWIFSWADRWIPARRPGGPPRAFGTPVIVFGAYDYDSPPPWQHLALNLGAADVDLSALDRVVGRYLPVLRQRAADRLSLEESLQKDATTQSESN